MPGMCPTTGFPKPWVPGMCSRAWPQHLLIPDMQRNKKVHSERTEAETFLTIDCMIKHARAPSELRFCEMEGLHSRTRQSLPVPSLCVIKAPFSPTPPAKPFPLLSAMSFKPGHGQRMSFTVCVCSPDGFSRVRNLSTIMCFAQHTGTHVEVLGDLSAA